MTRRDPTELTRFVVRHLQRDRRVVLEVRGDCEISTLERFNEALREAIADSSDGVVVDLRRTTFIDSLTLGSLTAAAKQVRANGRSFSVVGAEATAVRRAFEITGLDRYLLAES